MEVGKKSILKLKILFKKFLTKLGFNKQFDYGNYGKKRNLVFVVAAILLLIVAIVAFVVGGQYTTEALKNQVKELQTTLEGNNLEIGSLNSELGNKTAESIQKDKTILQCNNDLNHSEASLNECNNETVQLNSQLGYLESNITSLNSQNQALQNIVANSVRAFCCSFSAIQQGLQISWNINGNQIICGNGNYIVNCGSGPTNYPS